MAVKPGDILGKKYRVDALIGRGGMGDVFAATDIEGRVPPVAIKVVSRLVFDDTLIVRLRREAEAAARIRSEYVPRVLEVSDTDDREMFLVMERLVGEPLSERMRTVGPLPWAEVAQIGEDVLRGLIDAHTAGVVHRDLKPSNVFLALKGNRMRAMVLDFGVCKMDTGSPEHLTGTGESIGTVAYMAPEQIRGASRVDDRADLYAFGVLVFEMVCGRLPHDGPSQMAILASKLENEPARLRDCAGAATPDGLDALVARALVRDPEARIRSAQELLKAWRKLAAADVASGHGVTSARADVAESEDASHDPRGASTVLSVGRRRGGHESQTALTFASLRKGGGGRVAFGLAACALVAGVFAVAAFFARAPEVPSVGAASAALSASPSGEAVEVSAQATESESDTEPAAASGTIDLDDPAPAPAGSAHVAAKPGRARPRVRSSRPGAPKSTEPHITAQPRY